MGKSKKVTVTVDRVTGRVPKRNPDLVTIADVPFLVHVSGAVEMTGQQYAELHGSALRAALAYRPRINGNYSGEEAAPTPNHMTLSYDYR